MSATADGSDGKADTKSGGKSSYAMLPSDRKAVAVTRISADNSKNQIAEAKKKFAGKNLLGLYLDAKGIFSSSNVADVTEHMEKHSKFYEGVVKVTDMVEKGDKKSYDSLMDLFEELSEIEMDAQRDVKNNKSKVICEMLRNFLDEKYKLDHNLKKVECAVLKQKIREVEQICEMTREEMGKLREHMNELLEDQKKKLKEVIEEAEKKAEKKAEERFERQIQVLSQKIAEAWINKP